MNPMFTIFQHKFSAVETMADHGMIEGAAMCARIATGFCRMPVAPDTTTMNFPTMPTPVTWWNVKPHWR